MSSSQIMRYDLSYNYVTKFIKDNFILENNEYKCDTYIFKRLMMRNKIRELQEYLIDKYYNSKRNYPRNMTTYRGFNVVLRQLCNILKIKYRYHIQYIHSTYNIIYYITINDLVENNNNENNNNNNINQYSNESPKDKTKNLDKIVFK